MTDPVVCPHCREHLDIPAEYRGRAVRCASCQNVFATPPPQPERRSDAPPWRSDSPPRPRLDDDGYDRPRRKPNGGVWVLLLMTTLVLSGCIGLVTGFTYIVHNPDMHPYTSKEGKFRADFPGDIPPSADANGEKDGELVSATGHNTQRQERFTVKCFDLPAKYRGLPPEEAVEQLALEELKAAGGREKSRLELTMHDGFPACDVTDFEQKFAVNRQNTIVRCVLAGKRVYAVVAHGPNMQPQMWWVRKFFVSFEITDKPADGKNK